MSIAIIIPYFKFKFFRETLLSIRNQTDRRFKVYIGDDNSPNSPIRLIEEVFTDQIDFHYQKFEDNLGSYSLTKQWERCINLCTEQYIWLFSDDDIMPMDAIERAYSTIETLSTPDFLRFNIQIINDIGSTTFPMSHHPKHETAISFLHKRLNGEVISTVCEYIFSRNLYLKHKGFVEFPLAWAADDATWINFSLENGINLIPGKGISWRMGGTNISSSISNYKQKAEACICFIKFINAKFVINDELKLKWLIGQIDLLGRSKKMKVYFWSKIITSNVFSIWFIISQVKQVLKNFSH